MSTQDNLGHFLTDVANAIRTQEDSTEPINAQDFSSRILNFPAKFTQIEHGTNDTTLTIEPNVFHIWDEVSSLEINLGEPLLGIVSEYFFQFTSGTTPTTLILPDTIQWINDAPEIEENKTYQCSIINNIGVICGV